MLCVRQSLGMLFLAFGLAIAGDCRGEAGGARHRQLPRTGMSPLPNPANDARAMTAVLQGLHIKVEFLVDADRAVTLSALQRFAEATFEAELAVVHYSGHGMCRSSS
jgi:hypothetical protein